MTIKRPEHFLNQNYIQNQIMLVEKNFNMGKRKYFLVIKKCNYSLIHDIALKIDKLQKELFQPFEVSVPVIKEILVYYLPFAFILCLDAKEIKYVVNELKKIDPDIFISIQNQNSSAFAIILWNEKSNMWKNVLDENKYLDFANSYTQIVENNDKQYSSREINKKIILNLLRNQPLILFDNLTISEVIVIVNQLQRKKDYKLILSVADSLNVYHRKSFINIC